MTVGELIVALQQHPSDLPIKRFDAEWGPQAIDTARVYTAEEQLRDVGVSGARRQGLTTESFAPLIVIE